MYKRTCLCLLLVLSLMFGNIEVAQAAFFLDAPVTKCTCYSAATSRQLSGVTQNMTNTDVFITSKEDTKDYQFKFNVPSDAFVTVYTSFADTLYWNWQLNVYSDSTMKNLIKGEDFTTTDNNKQLTTLLESGDYYIDVKLKYNAAAVTGSSKTETNTKNPSGAAIVIKDPNVTYDKVTDTTTVMNMLRVGVTYVRPTDCVSVKATAINNVSTVVFDAANFVAEGNYSGQPYVQYRSDPDNEYGFWTYDDGKVWDLVKENWGLAVDSDSPIKHVQFKSEVPTNKTTLYMTKTGYYTFRIAQPTKEASNYNAVIKRLYVDCTSPTVKGFTNKKLYTKGVKVTFSDKGGVKSATVNGKSFSSGTKFTASKKYSIVVKDKQGNKTSKTFYIDSQKPTISGVSSNKTYKKSATVKCKDAVSGVKRVNVFIWYKNGSTYSKNYDGFDKYSTKTKLLKLTKAGTYKVTVTDWAGNTQSIKFKVK